MKNEKKIKPRSLFQKIFRISLIATISIIILLSIVTLVFYIYKDDISRALLEGVNDIQKGELIFEDISFSPFAHFPSISINLNNVLYYEHPIESMSDSADAIANINNIFVAFNLIDLIGGKVNVKEVTIVGGTVKLITYADSSVNLFNAFGKEKPGKLIVTKDISQIKTDNPTESKPIIQDSIIIESKTEIDLSIDKLSIENLTLKFENHVLDRSSKFRINNLNTSFTYREKRIISELKTDIDIIEIKFPDKILLADKKINLTTSLSFDEVNEIIFIYPSRFSFEESIFDIEGNINIGKEGLLDIKIDGSDHDFSFLSLILSEKGITQLERGDFYMKGTITGNTLLGNPVIELSFGLSDVDIFIPEVQKRIKGLNFSGYFISGTKKDLSEALLIINDLSAKLPDGQINASFSLSNFENPYIDLTLDMKTGLGGLDNVFNIDFIDSLNGTITIYDKFKGQYNSEEKRFVADEQDAQIICENMSFNLPGVMYVENFDGTIIRKTDKIILENLKVKSGYTDLLINGEINNIVYLLLNIEKEIIADLKIKSKMFDLPNFLSFDPTIGRDFPHRIKNLDLIVNASSTTSKLLEFNSFPEIDFNIIKLGATAEGFLPPLTINNGRFKVSENILGFHMDFDHFLFDIAGGQFNLTADYNSSKHQPFYIKADLQFDDINPAIFVYDDQSDSIPEIMNGSLNGSLFAELQFATDTMAMKLVSIKRGDLSYYFAEDTIETKSLEFFAKDVYYNSDNNPNPLATLTTNLLIKSKELYTNHFKVDDIHYDINADYGTYTVIPKQKSFFGSVGKGLHILKPFDEIPHYRIQYSISQFNAEDLLTTFLEDTVLTGKMDFSMDISMSGNEWDSLVSKLNGDIHLTGENLIMYGVDSDELIEKFKRSQKFTLVDIGAVLLAGPVGLAVTKGTDYASLIVLNSGEETHITKLVSDWNVHDGKLTVKDVAFATEKNRIAGYGWFNFAADSLDFSIALLNKNGCSIFSQDVFGTFEKPQTGEIKVVGTILAPVTNLWDDIWGNDCDVFYNGAVKHPN
jgi:AsmA protein